MTKYRLGHIPQVPMKAFEVHSDDLDYLVKLEDVLAQYDIFQFENNIKPDYSNMTFIQSLDEDGEWCDLDDFEITEILSGAIEEVRE